MSQHVVAERDYAILRRRIDLRYVQSVVRRFKNECQWTIAEGWATRVVEFPFISRLQYHEITDGQSTAAYSSSPICFTTLHRECHQIFQ